MTSEGGYDVYYDEWGIGYRRPRDAGLYFDQFDNPLKERDPEYVRAYPFPPG